MSKGLQYGGIHDSHFKYIQTTITSFSRPILKIFASKQMAS